MAPTVRARVLVKPRTLEAREFARPTIGLDDGLLRIEACGIYKELTIRGVLSMPVDVTFQAIELIEAGRYPFEKMHTSSLPLEQAEDAIHMLAGKIPGVNPIHLAIVPGAPRVDWRNG